MNRNVLVFGGCLGGTICDEFRENGDYVITARRTQGGRRGDVSVDVTDPASVHELKLMLCQARNLRIHVVVYAVGNCPKNGAHYVPTEAQAAEIRDELSTLLTAGFENVHKEFKDSAIVAIGSDETKLIKTKLYRPEYWARIEPYVLAMNDFETILRSKQHPNNSLHIVRPTSVIDSDFHMLPSGKQPNYVGVTKKQVAKEVLRILNSKHSDISQVVLPEFQRCKLVGVGGRLY